MVDFMENPIKMDDLRGFPIIFVQHPSIPTSHKRKFLDVVLGDIDVIMKRVSQYGKTECY